MRALRVLAALALLLALSASRSGVERTSVPTTSNVGQGGGTVQRPTGAPNDVHVGPGDTNAGVQSGYRVGAPILATVRNARPTSDSIPSASDNRRLSDERHPEPSITEMRQAPPAVVSGEASWFDIGPGLYGAWPGFVDGSVVWVTVTYHGRSVRVQGTTQCSCPGGRVIDLSAQAFQALAPLGVGLIYVEVQR